MNNSFLRPVMQAVLRYTFCTGIYCAFCLLLSIHLNLSRHRHNKLLIIIESTQSLVGWFGSATSIADLANSDFVAYRPKATHLLGFWENVCNSAKLHSFAVLTLLRIGQDLPWLSRFFRQYFHIHLQLSSSWSGLHPVHKSIGGPTLQQCLLLIVIFFKGNSPAVSSFSFLFWCMILASHKVYIQTAHSVRDVRLCCLMRTNLFSTCPNRKYSIEFPDVCCLCADQLICTSRALFLPKHKKCLNKHFFIRTPGYTIKNHSEWSV